MSTDKRRRTEAGDEENVHEQAQQQQTTPNKSHNGSDVKGKSTPVSSSVSESKHHDGELLQIMLRTKVERFVNPSNIVFVCFRDDKVVDVWKGLVKHNFLSCPVLQKTEHKYYGSIDMADIVSHLVKKFGSEALRDSEAFWQRLDETKVFGNLTVDNVMQHPLSRRNPFHPVREGYSLLHALELLAREEELHRVPVVSAHDRKLVNMITQSQVVDFLHKNLALFGDKKNKTLGEFPQFFKEVHSVKDSELAIDAFSKMVEHNISGVSVVNDEGHLTGNISLRDLKSVGYDLRLFWRFYQTVENYLVKLRKEFQEQHERPRHVVCVTKEDTLGTVVNTLAENHVHRLYIVDSKKDKKPIGVVSLKDVLSEMLDV